MPQPGQSGFSLDDRRGVQHPDDLAPTLPVDEGPRLKLINSEIGQVICEDCRRAERELEETRMHLKLAEKELQTYRLQVARLENRQAEKRKMHPKRPLVEEVFQKWQECTGHPRSKLTDDRMDTILKWLEHYAPEQIYWACAYIGAYPYKAAYGERAKTGPREARSDDIEMICSKAGRFEKWANLGYRMLRAEGKIEVSTLW